VDKYKKIYLISIGIFVFAVLFMIIGLGLLSFETFFNTKTNGFGLISSFEAFKNMEIPNNQIHGMLYIFKSEINSFENIGKIRCGVVFTVFITPILLFISFVGFGYNYFNFYKFYKDKN